MNKRCIINFFSHGREDYKSGSERLINTALAVGFVGDFLIFSPDFEKDYTSEFDSRKIFNIKGYPNTQKYGECKLHSEAPYQFKSYAFQYAKEHGYDEILWCDSSTYICKNPEHYFELAKEIGVVCFDNQGCPEATFTSDDCLEQIGCDPEYAKTFFQIEAFTILFNFNHPRANLIFDEYIKYSSDGICLKGASGSTRPEFKAHRHDQSILSYILRKHYGIPINYGGWVTHEDFFKGTNNPTFAKVGVLYQPFKEE